MEFREISGEDYATFIRCGHPHDQGASGLEYFRVTDPQATFYGVALDCGNRRLTSALFNEARYPIQQIQEILFCEGELLEQFARS